MLTAAQAGGLPHGNGRFEECATGAIGGLALGILNVTILTGFTAVLRTGLGHEVLLEDRAFSILTRFAGLLVDTLRLGPRFLSFSLLVLIHSKRIDRRGSEASILTPIEKSAKLIDTPNS